MFEIFEELLMKSYSIPFEILFHIGENQDYIFENLELMERSLNRAESVLISQEV